MDNTVKCGPCSGTGAVYSEDTDSYSDNCYACGKKAERIIIKPMPIFTRAQIGELVNLWHLARVPLSGKECTRYTRMQWAADQYSKAHAEISYMAAYKALDRQLAR